MGKVTDSWFDPLTFLFYGIKEKFTSVGRKAEGCEFQNAAPEAKYSETGSEQGVTMGYQSESSHSPWSQNSRRPCLRC